MISLPHVLFIVAGLLVVIGLLQPFAARLNLSPTVLLAGVGVVIGIGAGFLLQTASTNAFHEIASLILDFPISSSGFLFVFLPVLLFEAALTIDVRRLVDDAAPVFVLAVIAVLATTAAVGLALWPISEVPLVGCLLLAAIVATTDPAAVIAIFRDLGAPARLTQLVEGESLLNDATAIAIFTVLLDLLMTGEKVELGAATLIFAKAFLGGALVGLAGGRGLMAVVPWLRDSRLAEMTLTLALPYLVYTLCERYFGVSGVIGVVVAGLVVNAQSRRRLAPENQAFLQDVWQQLSFWAGSLVFVLASMLVPRLMIGFDGYDALLIAIVAVAALGARALVLFGLLPLLSAAQLAQRVGHRYKFVIMWGALRGAVTLALALGVTENRMIDPGIQRFVAIVATGFVLVTLLVNGTTLRPMIRILKLDRLSPIDQALRQQVLALSLTEVRDEIGTAAASYRIGSRPTADVLQPYRERIAEATDRNTFDIEIADRDRITLGLFAVTNQERELILEHFRQRSVSRRILERLLAGVERITDGARAEGRLGYVRAARRQLAFGWSFRLAHLLHRRARIDRPLIARLADRFEQLLVGRMVLEELARFVAQKMTLVFGQRVSELLGEIVGQRLSATVRALDALRLQYPAYADALERRFLRQTALRMEAAEYRTLHDEGLIGQELYNDLRREVEAREAAAAPRPRLDLGLATRELVGEFPLFAGLEPAQLDKISALLKPRFAVPGERLIRRGERGSVMFFISSGAVEVAVGSEKIQLGRGDFFGELALLGDRERRADVTALGYCQLLILDEVDFRALLATDASIHRQINQVAAERLEMNRARRRAG
ncbi:MAG TPA: cation:proton antiporter [Geminicoccaceae bacterium]|nr:cation:proton antiporter [Geminicoccaceae bacterium]